MGTGPRDVRLALLVAEVIAVERDAQCRLARNGTHATREPRELDGDGDLPSCVFGVRVADHDHVAARFPGEKIHRMVGALICAERLGLDDLGLILHDAQRELGDERQPIVGTAPSAHAHC